MQLIIIAVGTRMPGWVEAGFEEYRRRLPAEMRLELREIKPEPRTLGRPAAGLMQAEAQRIRAAIPKQSIIAALDEHGKDLTTLDFAAHLERWRAEASSVSWIIGGPDGLDPALKREAHLCLRLSSLTLPHAMVRIVLAEQIYRAWSVLQNHPYHRT